MSLDPGSIEVDRLVLGLPPGFESRAASVARLVAEELARRPLPVGLIADRLVVPFVAAHAGDTDAAVARRVADAVAGELGRRHRLDPSPPNGRRSPRRS